MRRPLLYAARFTAFLCAVTALAVLCVPSAPASSPYLSTLSMLYVGEAVAAPPTCEKQECDVKKCVHSPNFTNCNRFIDPRTGTLRCQATAC